MTNRTRDTLWGFLAPITPLAPLLYVFSSLTALRRAIRNLWSDVPSRYLLLALLGASAFGLTLNEDLLDAAASILALLLFILFAAYGAWGVEQPKRFLTALVLGGGFLGLVVAVARVLELEVTPYGIPVLTHFRDINSRGNVLGMASNGLAAMIEPAVVGGLGFALLRVRGRVFYLLAAVAGVAGIFVTLSRGSMLGVAVGTAVLVVLFLAVTRAQWKRIIVIVAAAALAVCLLASFTPGIAERIASIVDLSEHTQRVRIWTGAWHLFLDHPVFGSGPGSFGELYPKYRLPEEWEHATSPHSLYLYLLTEWGVVGFVIFFALLARLSVARMLRAPAHVQIVALAMSVPFWVHVLVDDLYMPHIALIMGCIANSGSRRDAG